MHQSFLSLVYVLQDAGDLSRMPAMVQVSGEEIMKSFKHFEIIVVNNKTGWDLSKMLENLPAELKKNTFLVNLSAKVHPNHAVIAGLDRSNGDFTILVAEPLPDISSHFENLYQKVQSGYDIVYCRSTRPPLAFSFGRKVFYWILKRFASTQVDPSELDTRIISRRALNALLQLRENPAFMKPLYRMIGYPIHFLEVKIDEKLQPRLRHGNRFADSLVALTTFTHFLRSISCWIFLFSCFIVFLVVLNAVLVKIIQIDLFGTPQEALSGWAFLVVIIAVFFSITSLNLYIFSIYLSNIYQEIKNRPLYLVESYQRLG